MKTFCFYDSDWFYGGNGDVKNHIQGVEFRKLLEACFRYCSYVALSISAKSEERFKKLLSPFEIAVPEAIAQDVYPQAYEACRWGRTKDGKSFPEIVSISNIRFYRACPDLLNVLYSISDSLFTWLDGWGFCNPENPTFYRSDGSVFFSSVIHEGECTLHVHDDEDVSEVIKNPLWIEKK